AVIMQLVSAVEAAHGAGVVHRDLKPENLLFASEPDGAGVRLKVVDFGIAKNVGAGATKTATGAMIGTPAYMAPEQIAGSPPPSPSTDVYAIGELLYEVLARARLFAEADAPAIVRAKMRGTPRSIALEGVPHARELASLIERCIAFEQSERPRLDE